ncbi:type VI secretion system baseplate subunit TssK [Xinfangfangia sp. CPCC 101601]|uniref:Type VI secretion system baseplate subunit TssK n=1 Tax=Pseudogemmobacter lacusdianii TaxID=3069608 RepID=A0ABU0VVD4_9RHOB|nr:type VI secretion system baseplate subunit TssK [Xinfangfangia sp. CPCC 101601]MDQ2065697.1 type VI secretion system baseplate subunit TssK [Xinfangfangia sp. CPCC 101601]
MSGSNRVLWSEGLFLRPQHFQQQDRHAEALMRSGLQVAPWQAWGFTKLEFDRAALDAGQLALRAAAGIFPDGTPFDLPQSAALPPPIPITSAMQGPVQLAIPVEQAGAATMDASHAEPSGARYRGEITEIRDTIRNGADPAEVELARLNLRLLAPGEALAGFVTLPLAQLEGLRADGSVAVRDGDLPPALTIAAASWYAGLLQEVVTGLDRIAEAHGQMVLGGAGRSVENLLILELANAARPEMAHHLAQSLIHPCALYEKLSALAGRMATYGSSSRRLTEMAVYNHADPQPAFAALADTLRSLMLSLRHVEPKSRALPVAKHSQNIWKVRIDNPELLKTSRIVLRIGSDLSEDMLRKLFVDQATVGAADAFEMLWKSRLPGIALKPLHSQPREIPYDGERLCLELNQKSEHWAQLLNAPGFVIGISGQLDREPQIDCYAVSR